MSKIKQTAFIILSFIIVAFGQPALSEILTIITSLCGYSFFWYPTIAIRQRKYKFITSTIWFTGIQMIQLSWMTSTKYVGIDLLFGYIILSLALGIQFGIISLLLNKKKLKKIAYILAVAGAWTILEWSRLFWLCGFTFNPLGLSLTYSSITSQIASVAGVFGLSFIVILTNLTFLRLLIWPHKKNYIIIFIFIASIPLCFGLFHHKATSKDDDRLKILIIQTGLEIKQKCLLPNMENDYILPFEQWTRILTILSEYRDENIDIILLPEATLSMPFYANISTHQLAINTLNEFLPHYNSENFNEDKTSNYFSNADYAQYIANHFKSHFVIGLENVTGTKAYSSAFVFKPFSQPEIYNKRILVPIGEYLPFEWLRKLAKTYGIINFFNHGESPLIIKHPKINYALSICYEDTFGELNRKHKQLGAQLLLNLTNDNWYPDSKLAEQHYHLARLRSIENGIPLARSCNTGMSAVIDAYNNEIGVITDEYGAKGAAFNVPTKNYNTVYSIVGDKGIICLSLLSLLCFIKRK